MYLFNFKYNSLLVTIINSQIEIIIMEKIKTDRSKLNEYYSLLSHFYLLNDKTNDLRIQKEEYRKFKSSKKYILYLLK